MKPVELLSRTYCLCREVHDVTWQEFGGISICAIGRDYVQVSKGIEALAEAAGQECRVRTLEDSDYPEEMSFEYNGVKYLELREG